MATILLDVKTSFTFFDMVNAKYLPWLLLLLAVVSLWRLQWASLTIPPVIGFVYYALLQTERQMGGQERWQAKGFETAIDNGLWLFLAALGLLALLSLLRWFQPKKISRYD